MPAATDIDATHDPATRSWVEAANADDAEFPIQNLPFGRFQAPGERRWRIGAPCTDRRKPISHSATRQTAWVR